MPRRILALAVLLAGLGAAPAGAAVSYGGGSLPGGRGASRAVGISFEPDDAGRLALRFDTRVLCGRGERYIVSGNAFGPWDGRHVLLRGTGRVALAAGRLTYRWVLKARLGPLGGAGRVRVTGRRRVRGRRTRACRLHPVRPLRVLPNLALTGAPTAAARNVTYLGLSRQNVATGAPGADGVRGSVILRTNPRRRLRARWTADARCPNGYQLGPITTLTPPTQVGPDGRFARDRAFRVHYANSVVRYAAHLDGELHQDGATGNLRVVATVAPRDGSSPFVCDSGVHAWDVLRRG